MPGGASPSFGDGVDMMANMSPEMMQACMARHGICISIGIGIGVWLLLVHLYAYPPKYRNVRVSYM